MTRAERWLTMIAVTGVGATIAGLRLVWMVVTAPSAIAALPAGVPHQLVAAGHWVWHLVQRVVEWL